MRKVAAFLAIGIVLSASSSAARSESIEDTIVFIRCIADGHEPIVGSAVLVSVDGDVLTAAHIIPEIPQNEWAAKNLACKGSIGTAETGSLDTLGIIKVDRAIDAARLKFSAPGPYEFKELCSLPRETVRKPIIAAGFPSNTKTGAVSYREGVLSNVLADFNGLIEVSAPTVSGMSGGPVFSKNLAGIVGIISEIDYNARAEPSYGVVSSATIELGLQLELHAEHCFAPKPGIDLPADFALQTFDGPEDKLLGLTVEQAFCAITTIFGNFNHNDDRAEIVVDDAGAYVLHIENKDSGLLGAKVRCIALE
jgi:hypothetical protein